MIKKRAKLGIKKEAVSYNRYKLHARVDEKFNILLKAESELRRITVFHLILIKVNKRS